MEIGNTSLRLIDELNANTSTWLQTLSCMLNVTQVEVSHKIDHRCTYAIQSDVSDGVRWLREIFEFSGDNRCSLYHAFVSRFYPVAARFETTFAIGAGWQI